MPKEYVLFILCLIPAFLVAIVSVLVKYEIIDLDGKMTEKFKSRFERNNERSNSLIDRVIKKISLAFHFIWLDKTQ